MRKFLCMFICVVSVFMFVQSDNAFADIAVPQPRPRPFSQQELQAKELLEACKKGDLEKVKKLIAEGANVNGINVSVGGRWGIDKNRLALRETPLCAASRNGHLSIVEELIKRGANVNARGEIWPPLIHAAFSGNNDIIKLLLKSGADVNAISLSGGVSSLETASRKGHAEAFKTLLAAGAEIGKGVLPAAVEGGNAEIVQILIDKGADISWKDGNGRTLLMPYRTCTPADVVKILLAQEKIDIHAVDHRNGGRNALMIASEKGCKDVIPLLLKAGLEVDSVTNSGETPLMGASRGRHYEIIRILLAAGANVNAEDKVDRTALVDAALSIGMGSTKIPIEKRFSTADLETIKILVAAGADANKKGPFGRTPLMFMAEYGITKGESSQKNLKEIVQILLKAGADTNAKDDRGNTVLQLAQKAGNKEIIKLLKKSGAKAPTEKQIVKEKIKKELKRKDKLICLYNKKLNLPQEYKGPNLKLEYKNTDKSFNTGISYTHLYIDERMKMSGSSTDMTGYGYGSVMFYDEEGCDEYWQLEKSYRNWKDSKEKYVNITDVPGYSYLKYIQERDEAKVLLSGSEYYNDYIRKKIKDIEDKTKEFQKNIATEDIKIMTDSLEEFKKVLDKSVLFYRSLTPEIMKEEEQMAKKAREKFNE